MNHVIEVVSIDGRRVENSLRDAALQLDRNSEIVLDFSSVRRIAPRALEDLQTLADLAREKAITIVLRGINIDLYRTLKLLDLTRHFSFRNEDQVL